MAGQQHRIERALAAVSDPPDLTEVGVDELWYRLARCLSARAEYAVSGGSLVAALRQHGATFSEIDRRVGLPRGTAHRWLRLHETTKGER